MGDPNPFKPITKPEECPELTPETFIQFMDSANVEAMCLQCIHGITDPYPGNKDGWKWYVPNEYVKKEFIDAYPGRFTAVGGVHARYGKEAAVEMVVSAHECGFPGIKIHPPTIGYPNNPDLYPAYEKCQELGLHVQIHTGVEELPGTRAKYQDPVYLDDIAMDFPDLKINMSHTGFPWIKEWIDLIWKHPTVYGDIAAYMPKGLDPEYLKFINSGIGRSKVMWGSNGLGLRRGKQEILELDWKDETKINVLRNNALRFIGIEE